MNITEGRRNASTVKEVKYVYIMNLDTTVSIARVKVYVSIARDETNVETVDLSLRLLLILKNRKY